MLNIVALMGRLTADPEVQKTSSGISCCRFTLAVERNYAKKGEERQADFIGCIAWRNQAEFLERYFCKGQLVAIDGMIQTSSYTDNTGNKRYSTTVTVNSINFTGDRRNDKQGKNNQKPVNDEPPLPEPPEQNSSGYQYYGDLPF